MMTKCLLAAFLAAASMGAFCDPVTSISYDRPARDWQRSSLTGNGTLGAMARGDLSNETVSLSHAKLYLPEPGTNMPVLVGHPRSQKPGTYTTRDGYMAACDLKISARLRRMKTTERGTDFLTGECFARGEDDRGGKYERRVVALRPQNLIAVKIVDDGKNDTSVTLAGIAPNGNYNVSAYAKLIRRVTNEPKYYRCDYAAENPWNDLVGYEVAMDERVREGGRVREIVIAVEPLKKGETSHLEAMKAKLAAALETGYEALLAAHVPTQKAYMERVSFELEGPADAQDIMRNFASGRYNIYSSTGGDHIPNLQGLWAGTWSAPWKASFTVNGNLPCAIAFYDRGNSTELNESLLKWIENRLPEFRAQAKMHYGARGFRIPGQTTIAGVETDSNANYPHIYWHGGAAWLLSRLYDGYRHTLDTDYLKRIYPLMKEIGEYYEDVLVELPTGYLGFNPSYSPENWPEGKRPTAVNATMDNAIAKQFLAEVAQAAQILGRDAEAAKKWLALRDRLAPYAVSDEGYFAEWLAPDQKDQNEHRHASHFYALYDEAPAEIVTNDALVASIKKSFDARMDFNENRSRTMAFGYVQNGLTACKIGDADRAERALKLLNAKNWLEGGGSCHDWQNIFNTDISGGYDYLIADMLVYSGDDVIRFLPAKPTSWTKGKIKGLLLRGKVTLEELAWEGDAFTAMLVGPSGKKTTVTGTAGKSVAVKGL